MSATIDAFHQRVSRAIRRGNVYDGDIPGYAYDAVRELEDMENWKYMYTEDTGTLTLSSGTLIPTGTPNIKSVSFLHLIDDNGDEIHLTKTRRENVTGIAAGRPGAYWMQSQDLIAFDALQDKAYSYILGYFRYTDPPLVDALPWLTIGEDLLIARTIRKMQPILRDDKLQARWKETEASKLPALQQAHIEHEYDGDDEAMIPFSKEIAEDTSVGAEFT